MLLLGGSSTSVPIAAKAWCVATAHCLGKNLIGKEIPEDSLFSEYFAESFKLDVPQLEIYEQPDLELLNAKKSKVLEKLTVKIPVKQEPMMTLS